MLGYNILMDTQKYAPQFVGNKMNCRNCHFEAGRTKNGVSLVGVGAAYPWYRERHRDSVNLVTRTNDCFETEHERKAFALRQQGDECYRHLLPLDFQRDTHLCRHPMVGAKALLGALINQIRPKAKRSMVRSVQHATGTMEREPRSHPLSGERIHSMTEQVWPS